MYTVYVHTNKINGKKYVGITSCDVNVRWKNGYGYSDKLPIGRAIRKYGWDCFTHEIINSNVTEAEAKKTEISLIQQWHTTDPIYGYNITSGGDGITGWKHTEETKKKLSNAAKKRVGSKNPNFGHQWTEEMKKIYGEARKRENLSEATIMKMSQSASGRFGDKNPFYGKHHTEETKMILAKLRWRAVAMFDVNGEFLHQFPSINEASKETGIHKVAISNCCRGITKTSGGFVWKYLDNSDL